MFSSTLNDKQGRDCLKPYLVHLLWGNNNKSHCIVPKIRKADGYERSNYRHLIHGKLGIMKPKGWEDILDKQLDSISPQKISDVNVCLIS